MNTTLVIMAAGIGSRFGGLKQATAITDDGKGILDFSVLDAKKAGFDKAVIILREDILSEFDERIGKRLKKIIDTTYVIQDTSSLPEGRKKPFGTGHAILACKDVVKTPFCIINADDYYGCNAFTAIEKHLEQAKKGEYAILVYELGNTLSKNGTVTRGVCSLNETDYLQGIEEVSKIPYDRRCIYQGKEQILPEKTPVSMNLWGLTTDIFDILEKEFEVFLKTADLNKDEFLIPTIIGESLIKYNTSCKAFFNKDRWYGITYKEDLDEVKQAMKKILEEGKYPEYN